MKQHLAAFAALALTMISISSASFAAGGDGSGHDPCPDVRATPNPGGVSWGGTEHTCGAVIHLFGLRIRITGPRCPERKYTYPPHQSCLGAPNEGTYCVPVGKLAVKVEKCECGSIDIAALGISVPTCDCTATDGGGHVQDARTLPCGLGGD